MNRIAAVVARHPNKLRALSDALMLAFLFALFGFMEGLIYVLLKNHDLYLFLTMLLVVALFSNVFAKFVASRIRHYV